MTLPTEKIFEGNYISVSKKTIRTAKGEFSREIVEHHPAAVIIPFVYPDTVYLIKQYRHAVEETLIEVSAGCLNPNEDPLQGALRELREETGLIAGKMTPLGEAFPAPGFCTEYLYFFLAQDLTQGETQWDEDEEIDCFTTSLSEMGRLIKSKTIRDAKTILSYYFLKEYLESITPS